MVRLPALRLAAVVVTASLALAAIAGAADIPALVARLGADDYREREQAGAELLALGQQAVPHLKAALVKSTDHEATRRLEVLVDRLQSVSITEPTRITLMCERKPAREVFDQLARLTGCAFIFSDAPRGALVSFDWRGTPFLQVLDQLCDALNSFWWIDSCTHQVVVKGCDAEGLRDPHLTYVGPFRACADTIALKREVRLSAVSRRGVPLPPPAVLKVEFSVQSESRLPICVVGEPVVLAAVDEFGNSLVLTKPDAEVSDQPTPWSFNHDERSEFTLRRASRLAESVKSCRVRVVVGCVTARRPEIVVADVVESRGQKFTGRTHLLELGETRRFKDHLVVDIVVSNRDAILPGGSGYGAWKSTVTERFEAFDEDGLALETSRHNVTESGASLAYWMKTSRVGGGRPKAVKLQFVEWAVKYQTVEFTFKDLPLP